MATVEFSSLVKKYGPLEVVHSIDLAIRDGEFVVLVGPSGCGKSTCLRMLAGLEEISGGKILIDGQIVNEIEPRDRNIAMVFQDYALYPHMSVYENMAFSLQYRGFNKKEIKTRVAAAATTLGLTDLLDRRPKQLSGGQRQRVAMGRAIVRDPQVFLFDEPLSNLDAKLRGSMRIEIKKLHRRLGVTTVYVTHDQVEAMTLADRVVVMNNGRIEQVGTPEQVYHHPETLFVASFIGSPTMNLVPAEQDGTLLRLNDGSVLIRQPENKAAQPGAKMFGVRPEDVTVAEGPPPEGHSEVEVVVDVIEALGADTLVFATVAGSPFAARVPPATRLQPGASARLRFPNDKTHLFDADTGKALA